MNFFLSKSAKSDLEEIKSYISQDSLKSAIQVINSIKNSIELIAFSPEIGIKKFISGKEIRIFFSKKYAIIYQIKNNQIYVNRIIHTARDYPKFTQ